MSTSPPPDAGHNPDDDPDFGPGGYLPERAAKRARKIVLRAQMGMHWIWGAVAVGVGVLIVGVIFLLTAGGPPGAPFVELAPVEAVAEGLSPVAPGATRDPHLSVEAGRMRMFALTPGVRIDWCEAARRYEGPDGVWSPTGRGLGGAPSLDEYPLVTVDGIVYWDPTTIHPGPVADPAPVERAC